MENKDPTLTKATDTDDAGNLNSASFKPVVELNIEIKQTEAILTPSVVNGSIISDQQPNATDNNQSADTAKHSLDKTNKAELGLKTINTANAESTKYWFGYLYVVACAFLIIAVCSSHIIGWRLATLSALPVSIPPVQYVESKTDLADYLSSNKQYAQAAAIYSAVIEKIKTNNMDKQLLSLAELKLAQALVNETSANKPRSRALVDDALDHLGSPNKNTPTTLIETLRSLGQDYIDKDDPYSAYPIAWAAVPFWKTGPTKGSEGNIFADLGFSLREKQDWVAAYKCFEHAFKITENWGDGDYNVYRLCEMGLAKANMQEHQEAVGLFKRATEMDVRLHKGRLSWSRSYLPTYIWSLIETQQLKNAQEALKTFSSRLETTDYYASIRRLIAACDKNTDTTTVTSVLENILQDKKFNSVADIAQIKTMLAKLKNNKTPSYNLRGSDFNALSKGNNPDNGK